MSGLTGVILMATGPSREYETATAELTQQTGDKARRSRATEKTIEIHRKSTMCVQSVCMHPCRLIVSALDSDTETRLSDFTPGGGGSEWWGDWKNGCPWSI